MYHQTINQHFFYRPKPNRKVLCFFDRSMLRAGFVEYGVSRANIGGRPCGGSFPPPIASVNGWGCCVVIKTSRPPLSVFATVASSQARARISPPCGSTALALFLETSPQTFCRLGFFPAPCVAGVSPRKRRRLIFLWRAPPPTAKCGRPGSVFPT